MFKAAWRTLQNQLKLWHEEIDDITVIYDFAILGREWHRILHFCSTPMALAALPSLFMPQNWAAKRWNDFPRFMQQTWLVHSYSKHYSSGYQLQGFWWDSEICASVKKYCKGGRLNPSSYLSRRAPEAQISRLVPQPPELCHQHSWWNLPVLSGAQVSGHSDAKQTLCCFLLFGANPHSRDGPPRNPSRVCLLWGEALLPVGMRSQRLLWSLSSRSLPLLWKFPQVFI